MDRALVIDDDDGLRAVVASHLADQDYDVVQASDARGALAAIDDAPLDLVVVDVDLPDVDGFEVLRQLRRATDAPMIVITTRSAETDRITGLDLGADDYVVKPLSIGELMARARAV